MFGRLLLLFILVPAIELYLLIQLGNQIGFWQTVGIIVLTGFVGSFLAKREGLQVWSTLNQKLASGQMPNKELLDGILILVAGALLITPGVLTDLFGLLGLLPISRAFIRKRLSKWFAQKQSQGNFQVSVFSQQFGAEHRSTPRDPNEISDFTWEELS